MGSVRKPVITVPVSQTREIVTGNKTPGRTINTPPVKEDKDQWSFGFRYFSQSRYFEIGDVDSGWLVSLLEILKSFSKTNKEEFLRNYSHKKAMRYHEINWESTNCPIARHDLKWVDKYILENEEEYPMLQFHVGKALGRVVGFWDGNIFQIVLLDPKHNIQPSKYNNYKVDDTYPMSCEYSSLLLDIQKIKDKINSGNPDGCKEILKIPYKLNDTNFFYCSLEDDYIEKIESSNLTLKEVIELGLLSIKT